MMFKHYKKESVLVKVAGQDQALELFLQKQGYVYILTEDASPAPTASQAEAAPVKEAESKAEEVAEKPSTKSKLFGGRKKK